MSTAAPDQPFVFSPGTTSVPSAEPDSLVNETRREIVEIVREVASAARSEQSIDSFLGLLVDRMLRAMAAEGVLVWRRDQSGGFDCIRRIGRLTDQTLLAESQATHARLLDAVAKDQQPVVVPATPGASDSEVPANPTHVPAALVPIELDTAGPIAYLIEVFLEPECGLATQRGYLRFVAQMADLAGEFLRASQLRQLQQSQTLARRVDAAIAGLHEINRRERLYAVIVDGATSLFQFDRVGLCALEPKTSLLSVSHVESIDQNSIAAAQLKESAEYEMPDEGVVWFDHSAERAEGEDLLLSAVAGSESDCQRRLVCMRVASAESIDREACQVQLARYMHHAEIAIENLSRIDAIPGGRAIASLAPRVHTQRGQMLRTLIVSAAIATVTMIAALFPIPLVVNSMATIRPADVQTVCSPRDAVVDKIHVEHGEKVAEGQTLLTLSDPDLEEQIIALVGRREVLTQQQAHWTEELVDSSSSQLDRMHQVQSQRRLVTEEIQSIDQQLMILERIKESLVLRATHPGTVDAWKVEQRLPNRPLQRGDVLLQVIALDSEWLAEVQVPQSRIGHVQNANLEQNLSAQVALQSDPSQPLTASLDQMGPSVAAESTTSGTEPYTRVSLRLDSDSGAFASQNFDSQSGAPARVMFHCGNAPAGYVVFQDLIRSIRGTTALYFLGGTES